MKQKTHTLLFLCTLSLIYTFIISVHAEDNTAQTCNNTYLEPEIVSNFFDAHFGSHLEKLVGNNRLEIKSLHGLDDALDSLGNISPFDIEMGFSTANMYLWRGQKLGSDTSFQPFVSASPDFEPFGDLVFTFWTDITKDTPGKNDLEYDFVVEYTFHMLELLKIIGCDESNCCYPLKKLLDFNLSTGYIYYWFPPATDDSHEIYWKLAYNLPFNPSFLISHDIDAGDGVWYEAGISQDFDLKLFVLSTFATLGYNHRQWGKTSAFSIFQFGGSIPVSIGTHITVEPFLSYSKRLKRTSTDDETDLVHDELLGGFNFVIGF